MSFAEFLLRFSNKFNEYGFRIEGGKTNRASIYGSYNCEAEIILNEVKINVRSPILHYLLYLKAEFKYDYPFEKVTFDLYT